MADQDYVDDVATGKHKPGGKKGDTAQCLSSHVGEYKEGNGCSHRWQGYRHATEDDGLYNGGAYASLIGAGSPMSPSTRPNAGDWDLTTTNEHWRWDKRSGSPSDGRFRTSARSPRSPIPTTRTI